MPPPCRNGCSTPAAARRLGPRAQTDKRQYARQMLQLLQHTPNLALREAMVTGLEVEGVPGEGGRRVIGVRTYFGSVYAAGAVVLTTGTFLGGRIWSG